ncbi:hypothetical protein EI982_08335 [Haloplanus rallus]|uniref:Uncharacterized protein n=1 Tax=Haloplanus rallus TaxID=1816183 RepID=A0A6B9F5W6_9EURY|nr:hypothetical protein EI982_08335 [Haloplanus rallus]
MVGWECPTNPREASGLDPEAVHSRRPPYCSSPSVSRLRRSRRRYRENAVSAYASWPDRSGT